MNILGTLTMRGLAARVVVGAVAALAADCAVFAQSSADPSKLCRKVDPIRVVEWPGNIQNIYAWVARDQGFHKKHCLDATLTPFSSGPAALAASLQGGVNFITLAPDTVFVPASQGMDIKIVAFMNDTVHYALVVGKHVPLPHKKDGYPTLMKDLVGKKIGVNALGSTVDIFAKANFSVAGLNPNQANWVAYGPPAAAIAGLINGSIDAAQFFGDSMDSVAAATGGTIVGDLRDPSTRTSPQIAALRGTSVVWVAQAAFAKKDPDVVRRFSRANAEAIGWIKDPRNFDAVVNIVREKAPSPPGVPDPEALLRERVKRYVAQVNPRGSRRALEAWSDWGLTMKRISKPADIDHLLWETAREMTDP